MYQSTKSILPIHKSAYCISNVFGVLKLSQFRPLLTPLLRFERDSASFLLFILQTQSTHQHHETRKHSQSPSRSCYSWPPDVTCVSSGSAVKPMPLGMFDARGSSEEMTSEVPTHGTHCYRDLDVCQELQTAS